VSAAPSGARSGALLAAASLAATALNYVFLLAAGRLLGSEDYGALAALLGLLTVILLPTGAVQLAVSREVSRRLAVGDGEGADAFGWAALRLGLIATAPVLALGLVLAFPLRELLNIESTSAVALAMAGLAAVISLPIAMGVLQGYQRFHTIAALYVVPFALRLGLLALAGSLGYRLGGAVFAAVAGGFGTAVLALWLLREPLRSGARATRPALRPFLRYLWPVFVGLIGIAVLTNADILVVKARFTAGEAGEYAAASAFARLAFFLPATILAVLFPRTAARQARGEDTADILGRSLLVTAAFCSLLTLFYALTGRGLVHTSFGGEFAEGGELLVPFTVSMALFALANILVGFHLSRGETRYAWIVAAAVPIQIAVLTLVPNSVRGVIWANIAIGISLLAAHEVFVGSSIPAVRAGLGRIPAAHVAQLRRVAAEGLVVLIAASALVCVLFWSVVSSIGSTFVGNEGSDSSGTIGWLWRLQQEGYHLFGETTHVLTGAPLGWEEANGLNLQWLLFYYPAYLAAKVIGEVAAFNLVVLSGYVFSGAAMYLLTRYLGCNRFVAAWAAGVFIVFPWHLERAEHPSFLHMEVLVFLVLALVAAAEKASTRRLALVGAATFACWLAVGYYGVMAAIGACAFALAASAVIARGRRLRLVVGVSAAALVGTVLMGIAGVSGGVGSGGGLDRELGDLSVYGLRPDELVVPSDQNLFIGDRLEAYHAARLHGSNATETENYVGLLTIALALGWLIVVWRRKSDLARRVVLATTGLVGVLFAALLFAAPTPVDLFGQVFSWPPTRLLWELIPAFRVPSRWVALVMTALVPLAALGLQAIWTAVGRRSRSDSTHRFAQIAVVAGAMAVSFFELTIDPAQPLGHTQPVPPEYAALSRTREGILAEYPLRASETYALWQRSHGRPLLNGAPEGTPADDLRRVLLDPAAPGTASALAFLGVTAIVVHPGTSDVEVVPRSPARGEGYELVERFADGSSVWKVGATPAPAVAFLRGPEFGAPHASTAAVVFHPLEGSNGQMEFLAHAAQVVDVHFEVVPARETSAIRVVGDATETTIEVSGATPVSITVAVPKGRSRVTVWTEPPPEGGGVGLELSSPRVERGSASPSVRAISVKS
jgi:O-antigen/teichoic acid export membrane protein